MDADEGLDQVGDGWPDDGEPVDRHWFAIDEEFQRYVAQLYDEWRARPSEDACEDFDEWKVAEIRHLRFEVAGLKQQRQERQSILLSEIENRRQAETEVSELTAELTKLYEEATAHLGTILTAREIIIAGRKSLGDTQDALRELVKACAIADTHEELSEYIDGSLLDRARATLPLERAKETL